MRVSGSWPEPVFTGQINYCSKNEAKIIRKMTKTKGWRKEI